MLSARRLPPLLPGLLRQVWPLVQRSPRCVLLTSSPAGEHAARALRLRCAACEVGAPLWFCVGRCSTAAADLRRDPRVRVELIDPAEARSIHLLGRATPLAQRPSPVLLHPSLAHTPLPVQPDELDFLLLRVDVADARIEDWRFVEPDTGPDTVPGWQDTMPPGQRGPSSLVPKILSPASPKPGMM